MKTLNLGITKRQLNQLNKFVSKDEYKPSFKMIHENDNFYTASDGYRLIVLFKDSNNKDINSPIEDEQFNNVFKKTILPEYYDKHNKMQITVSRDSFLELCNEIYSEIKEQYTKKKNDVIVRMNLDNSNTLKLSSYIYGNQIIDHLPEVKFKTEKVLDIIESSNIPYNINNLYGFNIKFLIDSLNITNSNTVTLYFNAHNRLFLLLESEDTFNLIMPVIVETDEETRERNKQREEEILKDESLEKERKEKEEAEAKKFLETAEESFKNKEYIDGDQFLALCKKYNITIPLKTHGWINKKFHSCTIDGNLKTYGKNTSNQIGIIIGDLEKAIKSGESSVQNCDNKTEIKLVKTVLQARDQFSFNTKLKEGKIKLNNVLHDELIKAILKKYPNYRSFDLNGDKTVLNVYSKKMVYTCSIQFNDYLLIVKESENGGLDREVYEIIK